MSDSNWNEFEIDALRSVFGNLYWEEGRPTRLLWKHIKMGLVDNAELGRLRVYVDLHPNELVNLEPVGNIDVPDSWRARARQIAQEIFADAQMTTDAPRWFARAFEPSVLTRELTSSRDTVSDEIESQLLSVDLEVARRSLEEALGELDEDGLYRSDPRGHTQALFDELEDSIDRFRRSFDLPVEAVAGMRTWTSELVANWNQVLDRSSVSGRFEVQLIADRTLIQDGMRDEVERIENAFGIDTRPLQSDIRQRIEKPWQKLVNTLFQAIDRGASA
jgi:hypothetical protein